MLERAADHRQRHEDDSHQTRGSTHPGTWPPPCRPCSPCEFLSLLAHPTHTWPHRAYDVHHNVPPRWTTFHRAGHINWAHLLSNSPHYFISIHLILSTRSFMALRVTCKKNKSTHPGVPDMTQSRLAATGLFNAPNACAPPRRGGADEGSGNCGLEGGTSCGSRTDSFECA